MRPTPHAVHAALMAGLFVSALCHATPVRVPYQGQLADNGELVNGAHDFRFAIYDAETSGAQLGSTVCADNVAVTNGLFTVMLDVDNHFNGDRRWLEIEVRTDAGADCTDPTGFTLLAPRQELTHAPHAAYSIEAGALNGQPGSFYLNAANLAGTISNDRLSTQVVRTDVSSFFNAMQVFQEGAAFSHPVGPPFYVTSTMMVGNLNAQLLGDRFFFEYLTTDAPFTGDVTGTFFETTVARLRGHNVSPAVPADGQVLKFNELTNSWEPAPDLGNAYTAGTGLVLTGQSFALATLGCTSTHLATSAVQTDKIENQAVTAAKLATNSVFSQHLFSDPNSLARVTAGLATTDGSALAIGSWPSPVQPSLVSILNENHNLPALVIEHSEVSSPTPGVIARARSTTEAVVVYNSDPTANSNGLRAISSSATGGSGIIGEISGGSPLGMAVLGININPDGYAVFAQGNSGASGTKTFRIDHPLDPANKFLTHYAAEGPEPMNVYRGTVLLDELGRADVELPTYFDAINRDIQYQLTCIGAFAPVFIAQEVVDNRFTIAGGAPGLKVCWTVTATRNDAFVRAHGAPVETDKPAHQRGKYLHPEFAGKPDSDAIHPRTAIVAPAPVAAQR